MFVRLLCCALLTLLTLFGSTASAAPALQEPLYGAEAILYSQNPVKHYTRKMQMYPHRLPL